MIPELHYKNHKVEAFVFGKSLQNYITEKDPRKQVYQQKEFLSEYFQLPKERIFILEQVHGFDCIHITEYDLIQNKNTYYQKADGMITSLENTLLCIRTADCMPVMFHSHPKKEICFVGILHIGWRGIVRGLLLNGIKMMHHYIEKIKYEYKVIKKQSYDSIIGNPITIFPGPYIPGSIYEVDEDVAYQFPIRRKKNDHKYLLDLWENSVFVLKNLKESRNIEIIDPFDYINSNQEEIFEKFYSHRRGDTFRNLNVIYIKE
ncbi:MAG: polyphenol oxidase family protein [Leptospiraceae bacterium]|nr:polyphenol oxidase family protein [Leptospiraceae bacterium]MDW7976052.1 polyphenol oxidase family protein [Leptospiraceae bacterium]